MAALYSLLPICCVIALTMYKQVALDLSPLKWLDDSQCHRRHPAHLVPQVRLPDNPRLECVVDSFVFIACMQWAMHT